MGSYSMQVNQSTKQMVIKIVGNFTPQQAKEFIDDYNRHVSSINPTDYVLLVDCLELKVVKPELIPALRDCYTLYKSSGFKTVLFDKINSATIKMQLARIAKEVGLTNVEYNMN